VVRRGKAVLHLPVILANLGKHAIKTRRKTHGAGKVYRTGTLAVTLLKKSKLIRPAPPSFFRQQFFVKPVPAAHC
jgi:hypothetical protein